VRKKSENNKMVYDNKWHVFILGILNKRRQIQMKLLKGNSGTREGYIE
jgi:hypothetical protein